MTSVTAIPRPKSEPEERRPPANLEAEQSVLGAIMLQGEALDRVADLLRPEDFYREAHGQIYRAMLDLYQRREPVDLVTVTARLQDRQILDEVGGPVFLTDLNAQVGTAVNVDYYAKIIHEKSVLRRLIARAEEIASSCYTPVEDVAELLDWAESRVFEIAESTLRPGFHPVNQLVHSEVATLEAIWSRGELITGISTGFRELDKLTAGLQPSDLIVLAARPSMGKTALSLNIAFNVAFQGKVTVAIFSLEMSKEQLVRRLLSAVGLVDASHLRRAFLTDADWNSLQLAASHLMECPIVIDDTPAATVLEIRAKCRRLKAEGILGLVIIDYLQLMRGRKELGSREQEISEISRSLKALAKELNVPVLALSQLNRRVEDRPNKRPQLADLRESGAIEQDADVVLFIYRDEVYKEDSPEKGTAEISIGKQRNGPTGKFKLAYRDKFTRFDDFAEEEPPPAF
ncbi:MAG: replicative DNA helicase [Desulfobacca sp. 4484_104]|nr:MAG: replicative DNA helicase [Desulfobacca sp. 4484_104]RLA90862.1 MAG: replicative DNA helicase [Deltaproteobacteria bacterium]